MLASLPCQHSLNGHIQYELLEDTNLEATPHRANGNIGCLLCITRAEAAHRTGLVLLKRYSVPQVPKRKGYGIDGTSSSLFPLLQCRPGCDVHSLHGPRLKTSG